MRVCLSCTTTYADAGVCPHCASTESAEEWEMAKISQAGGPSYRGSEVAPTLNGEGVDVTDLAVGHGAIEDIELPPADQEEPGQLLAEVVPAGTVDEIIDWTEADTDPPARLLAARDTEAARDTPRVTLLGELERRLGQF